MGGYVIQQNRHGKPVALFRYPPRTILKSGFSSTVCHFLGIYSYISSTKTTTINLYLKLMLCWERKENYCMIWVHSRKRGHIPNIWLTPPFEPRLWSVISCFGTICHFSRIKCQLFHDGGPYLPLICRANQCTGFYMLMFGTVVMKEFIFELTANPNGIA